MEIKVIKTLDELNKVFKFLSKVFYNDAKEYNEHYYTMQERYDEMNTQFKNDNELLIYIEEGNNIVAALTSKNMDLERKKISMGVLGVKKEYRRRGYAKDLVIEFERKCKNKGITNIELGARFRACPLYLSLGYKPKLMVQIFDFETIEDIRKNNIFNLKESSSYQSDAFGFVFYEIDEVNEKYIKCFEDKLCTAHVQYVFDKYLEGK